MATLSEVIKLMGVLSLAYPNYAPKQGASKVYHMVLEDIPYDALEAGAKACVAKQSAFFPSAGEWRNEAMNVMVNKLHIPSAFEAWENVQSEMRRCHDYYRWLGNPYAKMPEFAHPLIKRAVDIMGYVQLYESENQVADRAHFFRVYDSLLDRSIEEQKQLPAVRVVAEQYANRQLEAGNAMKQLAERMTK